jgi:retinol-binding protein 3
VDVPSSSRRFSAAEEFTYGLQARKRATIVGETSGGDGRDAEGFVLSPHLVAFIPTAKAVNPNTKTCWDGVGDCFDDLINEDQALDTAYAMALQKKLDRTIDPG